MTNEPKSKKVLTDKLLRSWIRCRRKAWLDKFGDSSKRIWTAHRNLELIEQQKSFNAFLNCKPEKGLESLKKGALRISGVRLKGVLEENFYIEAHPEFLQRVDGNSIWGEFTYRPILARHGKKISRENRLILTLLSLLLEKVQKDPIKEGVVVSFREKSGLEVEKILIKESLKKQLFTTLYKLSKDLGSSKPPPISSDRKKCALCSWKEVCNIEAIKSDHLREVSGIGSKRQEILNTLNIRSISDLASQSSDKLTEEMLTFGKQHSVVAKKIISQAKSQRDGKAIRIKSEPSLPEIKSAPGVIIYDIESDPDSGEDFLHGFLSIKKSKENRWDLESAKYNPILVFKSYANKHIYWERIYSALSKYHGWPILHYGETESYSINRLAKLETVNTAKITLIKNQLIDIHPRVINFWRLPINSYGLKPVAGWLNFKWSQNGADGARALLWWRQWKDLNKISSNAHHKLNNIFKYNRDDCIATWIVASWLIKEDANL